MADCRIVNQNVASSVTNIDNLATKYANAGTEFETAFKAAIAEMEGDSKDALIELFDKSYKEFQVFSKEIVTILKKLTHRLLKVLEAADRAEYSAYMWLCLLNYK